MRTATLLWIGFAMALLLVGIRELLLEWEDRNATRRYENYLKERLLEKESR
jgi:hypothetical protein